MRSTDSNNPSLVHDERGAVMVMGLAMILGLIAFLWYVLGIGQTLAFRDHMQDAADAAAFSQPAVEAAGMNVIVLLNMLIMLVVIIYLIASVIVTVIYISAVIACLNCLDPLESAVACPICAADVIDYINAYDKRNDFSNDVLKYVYMGLSILESGVALLAPWAGTVASYDAGTSFQMKSQIQSGGTIIPIVLSPNNFPDLSAITSLGRAQGPEYGLPVTHEPLGDDCSHLIDMIFGALGGVMGKVGLPGKIMSMLNFASGVLGGAVQWYYCDNSSAPPFPIPSWAKKILKFFPAGLERELLGGGDGSDYWRDPGYGPMVDFKHKYTPNPADDIFTWAKADQKRHDPEQKNGADHNQSYAFVALPNAFEDANATHNIKLMQLQHMQGFTNNAEVHPSYLFYFSQAELYFDCEKGWRSPKCNDIIANDDREDMVMYEFGWRARLVKFHTPEGSTITKVLDIVNKGLSMVTDVKGWINGGASNPFIQTLQLLDKLTGLDIIGMIGSIADIPPTQIFH